MARIIQSAGNYPFSKILNFYTQFYPLFCYEKAWNIDNPEIREAESEDGDQNKDESEVLEAEGADDDGKLMKRLTRELMEGKFGKRTDGMTKSGHLRMLNYYTV